MSSGDLEREVKSAFGRRFPGNAPRIFHAPGRVNLIGEHTDYNGGFVLPAAIDRRVVIAARARTDRVVRLWSVNFAQGTEFSLDGIQPEPQRPWSNYARGVAWVLEQRGFVLRGVDAVIAGDVPIGAGLSSSAAIEVATAVALRALLHLDLVDVELALACQKAENDFVGMKCGIMDQFISALGRRGHALLIDCRSLQYEPAPLPDGFSIVVCDTMKRRGLVDSEYNARRSECEQGVELLRRFLPGIAQLRDVSRADLERFGEALPPVVRKRCAHVVSENERTVNAVQALRSGKVEEFGRLMDGSHLSLRDDYQVSCHELDRMVDLARAVPGCDGARMTGAGFGGCTVNLVRVGAVSAFVETVSNKYVAEMGARPEVYVCQASAGAGESD